MVSNLAIGKQGYESVHDHLVGLEGRAGDLQRRLVRLMEEDASAYDMVVAAMRRPKTNNAEREARGVAALLAEAGLRGASLNARINLAAIRDHSIRAKLEQRLSSILSKADKVGHDVMALVE